MSQILLEIAGRKIALAGYCDAFDKSPRALLVFRDAAEFSASCGEVGCLSFLCEGKVIRSMEVVFHSGIKAGAIEVVCEELPDVVSEVFRGNQ